MKKRTIVIASVLKPVDDTRMFEKFGVSLSDSGSHVVIIGYPSRVQPSYPNIEFFPLKRFPRISFRRFLAPYKVLLILAKLKHDILIVNTHELLIVAVLNRILFGARIIYDIRENYYRNILYTDAFPKIFRRLISLWVRAKEKVTAPFFHRFVLAETGYRSELSFIGTGTRNVIIENKPKVPIHLSRTKSPGRIRLLFSGTLAASTGVFQAIKLAKDLHQLDPGIELHIIGYAAQPLTRQHILSDISGHAFIRLTGGHELVPHSEIMSAQFDADFGIILYPPSPHTQNSMPTKLYEYLGTKLPILLQNHQPWVACCKPFNAAIVLTEPIDLNAVLSKMKTADFYSRAPEPASWSSEEIKLLNMVENLA